MAMQKRVINVETGRQQLVDLSAEELADKQQMEAAAAAEERARVAAVEQLAADRATVLGGEVLGAASAKERQAFARLLGLGGAGSGL